MSQIEEKELFAPNDGSSDIGRGIHEKVYMKGGVDYDKLVERFGCKVIDDALRKKMEEVTKKPLHTLIKRGVIYSHKVIHSSSFNLVIT
jgi:hypothetical protein